LVPDSRRFSSVTRIRGQGAQSAALYKTSALIRMSEAREVLVTGKPSNFLGRMVGIHRTPVIEMLSRWKLDRVTLLAASRSSEHWSNIATQNTRRVGLLGTARPIG